MAAEPLPATTIGRVCLRVGDAERVTNFYESVVGLCVLTVTDDRVVLGAGEEPLVVLIEDAATPPRGEDETGLFHTAFLLPSRAALGDALARVETHWRLDGASDHAVSEALYCSDPEGNGVELYRDRPRDSWPITNDGEIGIDTNPLALEAIRRVGREQPTAPSRTTVGHVHLEVSSLEASRAFYVDTVGMERTRRYGESALFVAAGGYHHHLGLNVWNGRSTPPRGRGLEWYELLVPDGDTLEILRGRLDRRGIDTRETDDGEGVKTADPDGIEIQLSIQR